MAKLVGPIKPITDTDYALAEVVMAHRAERAYGDTYEAIINGPLVLSPKASQRFREIMAQPRVPLQDPPLPLDG